MSDDDMQRIGIARLGDRIALRVFCQRNNHSRQSSSTSSGNINTSTLTSTDDLIARLKEKLHRAKPKVHSHMTGNKFATKSSRRIEVGWLNFDESSCQFRQVREKCGGGGTRKLVVAGNCDMNAILNYAKDLFFPNGKSRGRWRTLLVK